MTDPTNFGIPDFYGNSPDGGFNGSCLVGFQTLNLGGNSAVQTRTHFFKLSTNPFSDIEHSLPPSVHGAYDESFFMTFTILCLMECPSGMYYDSASCSDCLANCSICQNGTHCDQCDLSFTLNSGSTACILCSFYITDCSDCLSSSYCTNCTNNTLLFNNTQCVSCDFFMPNCTVC